MLQKSTHCHQRTLSWTTGPSVTSPWLGLRWCWPDTSPPTSSPTIFRQVNCCAVQGQREASNDGWWCSQIFIFSIHPSSHRPQLTQQLLLKVFVWSSPGSHSSSPRTSSRGGWPSWSPCSWCWSTSSTMLPPTLPRLRVWLPLRPGCWPAFSLCLVL